MDDILSPEDQATFDEAKREYKQRSKPNDCEKCGGELSSKMVGDESYGYCADCNWVTY